MTFGVRVFVCAALNIALLAGTVSGTSQKPEGVKAGDAVQADVTESERLSLRAERASVEDWNDITLKKSSLKARPVALGEIDSHEKFTRERVQVQWRAGDPIDLYIMKPKGVLNPPVILYLASFPSETTRFMDDGFCERITKSGFAAIGFVSAMTGDRFQNRPMKEWFISEFRESLVSTAHDVQMILNYLDSRKEFDLSKVGMIGNGSGATIAVLAASADPRIQAVDLIDPWADWPEWLAKSPIVPDAERQNYLKEGFLKDVKTLDPLETLPSLKTPHVRLQIIDGDAAVTDPILEKLISATPASIQIERSENALVHSSKMSDGKLYQWLKDQLSAPAQSQAAQTHP